MSTITEENIYASSSDEIISKDVVVDLFPLYSPEAHNDDDFRCNKKVIKLNSSDVIRLLNLFEPTYENFENYLYPIFHSPFKGESILEIVLGWYSNGTEHENDKIIQYYNENFNIKIRDVIRVRVREEYSTFFRVRVNTREYVTRVYSSKKVNLDRFYSYSNTRSIQFGVKTRVLLRQ